MLSKIKSALRVAMTSGFEKSTGLESLSTRELVDLVAAKGAFSQNLVPDTSLLWSPWNSFMSPQFLNCRQMASFVGALKSQLAGKPILELGVGKHFPLHEQICENIFKASEYTACDKQNLYPEGREGFINDDLLVVLDEYYIPGQTVLAFGVFNEPLDIIYDFWFPAKNPSVATAGHVEYEYIKRLITQLHRVVSSGGLVIGDGIHPLDREFMVQQLANYDVGMHEPLFDLLADGYKRIDFKNRPDIRDPFLLTIAEN